MARNSNTFEKMKREQEKKQKAEDKRARRLKKKQEETGAPVNAGSDEPAPSGDES